MTKSIKEKLQLLIDEVPIELKERPGLQTGQYKLNNDHIGAIQAAYFAKRPLLVRGGPGLGKSQLAHAIASYFDWGLLSSPVHYNTTIDDLLYSIDHIARLDAANSNNTKVDELKDYIVPGKLWQAIAPDTLENFNLTKPHQFDGTVMLIDEIDKADSTLPNALLDVLATGTINVPCISEPIESETNHPHFIVITSNSERLLPQAFIRRCAVLELSMPEDEDEAVKWLLDIFVTHFPECENNDTDKQQAKSVAKMVFSQRESQNEGDYQAGTSEFLDMMRALFEFAPEQRTKQTERLSKHLINKSQLDSSNV